MYKAVYLARFKREALASILEHTTPKMQRLLRQTYRIVQSLASQRTLRLSGGGGTTVAMVGSCNRLEEEEDFFNEKGERAFAPLSAIIVFMGQFNEAVAPLSVIIVFIGQFNENPKYIQCSRSRSRLPGWVEQLRSLGRGFS